MKTIKLFLLAIIAMCFCTNVNAVELGDYMEIDGVPSIVIYVDASGKHGLVMSATAHDSKENKKISKIFNSKYWMNNKDKYYEIYQEHRFDFEEAYLNMPTFDYKGYKKMHKNIQEKCLVALSSQTSEYGKENLKIIMDYCETNNMDLSIYFPDQAWANSLGADWYIPGNAELELYAAFLNHEIGEDYDESVFKIQGKDKYTNGIWSAYHLQRGILGYQGLLIFDQFLAPTNVKSSTLIKSDWSFADENKGKICTNGNGYGINGDINQKKQYNDFYCFGCLGAGSNINPKVYLAFYRNNYSNPWTWAPKGPFIVAVKEF